MRERIRWLRDATAQYSSVDLALGLTLVGLLLRPVGDWTIRPFLLTFAVLGLVFPAIRRAPAFWWGLFLLAACRVVLDWPLPDNHAYLLFWWCLACALCLPIRDEGRALTTSARWLIGFTFLFAVVWKAALSPDFLDQRFFRVTFLLDPRFHGLTELGGGLSTETIDLLHARLHAHVDGPQAAVASTPALPPRFDGLVGVATLATLALETIVALSFLWAGERGLARVRDVALLLFCGTTYAVATVEGFAWLLLAMGLAQCDAARARMRLAYLAVFILVLFYRELPWADLLRPALARVGS